jgi:hypothetical protein
VNYPIRGQFDTEGVARFGTNFNPILTIPRRGASALNLTMQLSAEPKETASRGS